MLRISKIGVAVFARPCDSALRTTGSGLDYHGRQSWHADISDQWPKISIENLVRKLFLGRPLPTGHDEGADNYG